MEIVEDFDEKSDNNNGKTLEIVEDFACEAKFLDFFIVRHFSSLFVIFRHFSSFSVMFFHVLSCSFMFFHVLSFSFSLLGAQNLIFSGLNFVTISLDRSHVKKQFWGPSRVVHPFGPSFPFFPPFFSPVFFFFFFCFLFFHVFSFFVHFFIFLNFLMFFIFFLHFSEEKVSSFLFSCISFKYFLLLALVSEFNCFLRSRCSMEMWCPDDIGRDSWDWVGPPAWGRACFNSPE